MFKNQAEALELIAKIKDKLADRQRILEIQSHPVAQAMPVLAQLFCELQKVIGGPANIAAAKGLQVVRQVGGGARAGYTDRLGGRGSRGDDLNARSARGDSPQRPGAGDAAGVMHIGAHA
jgi:hypothetical protein